MSNTSIENVTRTRYLSARHGWVDYEVPDARLQLVTERKTLRQVGVHNQISVPNPRGGFDEMTPEEENRLNGVERGLVFTIKPRQGEKQAFVEVLSLRFFDEEMIRDLLDGLTLFDTELNPVSDPNLVGDRFCLPSTQAEAFMRRVSQRGGELQEASADLKGMHQNFESLLLLHAELKQLCSLSRAVIARIAEGIQADAPSISERSREAYLIRERAAGIAARVRDEHLALERQPGQIEQKAWALECAEKCERWLTEIEKLFKVHKSYETQAVMRVKEKLSGSLPSPDSPTAQRHFLFKEVVEYYTDRGLDAQLTQEGMKIKAGDMIVELTDRVLIHQNGQSFSGDVLLERDSAERSQRTL